jgi:hypothetical protein
VNQRRILVVSLLPGARVADTCHFGEEIADRRPA